MKIKAAQAYLERGWHVFTVQENKRPWKNCAECPASAGHSGEECGHLYCHGFQAASTTWSRVQDQILGRPGGLLAIRTGTLSGLVVVDAEGTDRVGCGKTGLEVLDEYDWWGDTLKATTGGGGLHLYYRWEEDTVPVSSRNRVLGNVDIKGDGGYVVAPPADGRGWINWTSTGGSAAVPAAELREWLTTVSGHGGGGSAGNGRMPRIEPGQKVPAGVRYEYTRGLVYKLRRQGTSREAAEEICRLWWERYEQPPVAEYELPWSQVLYELERVWVRVEPETRAGVAAQQWWRSQ